MKIFRVVFAVMLIFGLVPAHAAEKRFIAETDLFRFKWIADPQISPDGTSVVFVRVVVNEKRNGYDTSLWLVPTAGTDPARQLTAGPRDLSPRWAPNGRHVAFLRSVEKEGKSQPAQMYLLAMQGGEARPLTELKSGAGSPAWAPDGKTLAFTTSEDPGKKEETPREGGYKSDVRVINRAVYRFNGRGYIDPAEHAHIWTVPVDVTSNTLTRPTQVTTGAFDDENPVWSKDGVSIYFTSTRSVEPYYEADDADLFSVPASGGEATKVASIDGTIGAFAFSPDGRLIAFAGTINGRPIRSYDQSDLFFTDNAPQSPIRNVTSTYDFDIGAGIGSDQHAPRGGQPRGVLWSQDGRSLTVVSTEHGKANLKRFDLTTGKAEDLTTGDHEVVSYTQSADGSKVAMLVSTSTNIGDILLLDIAAAKTVHLTNINKDLFDELTITPHEEFSYTTFDGKKVQGWIQKPPDFDPAKKHPMILEIHGGPHSAYGNAFTHEFQWMAAKGYVVVYTNPRGSTSYGQEFGNLIQYRYPGDDHKDLMAGVDEVIKRGYIDTNRLGVTGGSGGGVLTNWAVTQTDRFKAAVSQRSIADWAGFWYTADFTLFTPTWFRAAPWQAPSDFTTRSPITHVARVTTPMMFIEGESDMRTPPGEGGEAMFRALKFMKKPTVMIRFPGETHELSRSGQPWHRIERLQHIVNWFEKYLQDKPITMYEVTP